MPGLGRALEREGGKRKMLGGLCFAIQSAGLEYCCYPINWSTVTSINWSTVAIQSTGVLCIFRTKGFSIDSVKWGHFEAFVLKLQTFYSCLISTFCAFIKCLTNRPACIVT